jgi:hypothetical protein
MISETAPTRFRRLSRRSKTVASKKTELHAVEIKDLEDDATPPISVGNSLNAADFAIDQSHMEEFATDEDGPPDVTCTKPPKGTFFTVRAETSKPWRDREFYFLLELKDRDPYIVAPRIAQLKKEEDVIRPVLIVRYVTMTGDEGLWALKIDPPDRKANAWNKSAMTVLKVAEEGRWVRLMSAKGRYHHTVSKKTYEQTPPRYSDRTFKELINLVFECRMVADLDHEIWDLLDNGSDK